LARLLQTPKLRVTGDSLFVLEAFALRFSVQAVSPWIAHRAATYAWAHRDPADRHILATAEFLGLSLVTADAEITPFAASVGVAVVW
jgi:PIN domain nuclease of toxin-antitoxin system